MTIGDNITPTRPLPRILCLHGGGVNGGVFRLQCRTIISQLAHTFRLVFMDAPYASSPHPDIVAVYGHLGPFHRWLPSTDEEQPAAGAGAGAAARHVMDSCLAAMDNDDGSGPWVGVLGFSQGAKIAISLLWAQRRAEVLLGQGHARTDFRFGVVMAGSAPVVCLDPRLPRPRHVADATADVSGPLFEDWPDAPCGHHVVDIPTLHVHGLKDAGLERHRKLLALYCEPGRTSVVEWDAGHRLPFKTGDVRRVVSSMLDMARQEGVVV
ncbi:hypothetical protein C2857_005172 [Epichloe festucae Fl1]|uniref:Serine hydrolase domain-containing protein n=1 Tax=Epichloe festucae (strain Fl1) TaxID=877507 RepID=A0A7U3Q2G4_EPIFF|nr:hypothetical protein C2857_005172 [Epichloe festucae Fl1]